MCMADAPAKTSSNDVAAPSAVAPVRANSIVLTAAGPDRPGIVHDVCSTLAAQAQANIEESRMTILGNDFAIILRVTVPETHSASKVAELMQKAFPDFVVSGRSTTTHPIFTSPVRIFSVAVEGPDQPGIVQILTNLFLEHKGSIRDLDTDTSNAPFAGYKIFSLKSVVALPINADFASFEASLHKFEDEFGFDVDVNEGMNDTTEDEQQREDGEEEEGEEEGEEEEEEEEAPPARKPMVGRVGAPATRGSAAPAAPARTFAPPPASSPAARRPTGADLMGPPPAARGPSRSMPPPPAGAPRSAPTGASTRGPSAPARNPMPPTGPSRGPVRK